MFTALVKTTLFLQLIYYFLGENTIFPLSLQFFSPTMDKSYCDITDMTNMNNQTENDIAIQKPKKR